MANISLKNKDGVSTVYNNVEILSVPSATSGTVEFGADYVKTVSSTPATKDTSIIYNSTNHKYYAWRD